jgi:hypothetical protein
VRSEQLTPVGLLHVGVAELGMDFFSDIRKGWRYLAHGFHYLAHNCYLAHTHMTLTPY